MKVSQYYTEKLSEIRWSRSHLITLTRENPEQNYKILSNGWYLLKNFNAMYIKRLSQELMKKYGKGHKIEIEDKN